MVQRRIVILPLPDMLDEKWEERLRGLECRYPGAADRPEAEMRFFYVMAQNLEVAVHRSIVWLAHDLGVARGPLAAGMTRRQLARRILARWEAPGVQQLLRWSARYANQEEIARLRRNPEDAREMLQIGVMPVRVVWLLEQAGHPEEAQELLEGLTPAQTRLYQAHVRAARIAFHRWVLHPFEGLAQRRRRWEHRRLVHRLRQGQVRLRRLQTDLRHLKLARKEGRRRARQARQAAEQALTDATRRLEVLRQREEAAEEAHQRALADLAARCEEQAAARRRTLQRFLSEAGAVLASRARLQATASLQGATVAIIGDEERTEGYQTLIEAAGGRLVHVSGVKQLRRIPAAVQQADVVLVMTDGVKHAAAWLMRKAARKSDRLVLRCPASGLGSLARTLREEVVPRLAPRSAAASRDGEGISREG